MTEYDRTSTPRWVAWPMTASGRDTLNPNTTPPLASARSMSLCMISPGWASRNRSTTFVCGREPRDALIASTEPEVSALRMMFSLAGSPSSLFQSSFRFANVTLEPPPACSASRPSRSSMAASEARCLATASLSHTSKVVPAVGTSLRPRICTGVEGPASSMGSPVSPSSARTRPCMEPASTASPTRSVPACTSIVAVGPRALSRNASMTVPAAGRHGFALSSHTSATNERFSNSSGTPWPVCALTGIMGVSPPHSSGSKPCSDNICLTRSTLAPSLSILLIATMMGTSAAWACRIASTVCGLTPSSAAQMTMATSVTRAPRARMALNASCPGVSKKVSFLGSSSPMSTSTWYAPIACVMPPASPFATRVWRM
mmetsp:Transcript_37212/g.81028  ORF Transcript_37212/g.81028 Transcript_37212/m.81028 type:complete len:373 (+) Transcript_37212:768-1886(+)